MFLKLVKEFLFFEIRETEIETTAKHFLSHTFQTLSPVISLSLPTCPLVLLVLQQNVDYTQIALQNNDSNDT